MQGPSPPPPTSEHAETSSLRPAVGQQETTSGEALGKINSLQDREQPHAFSLSLSHMQARERLH